MLYSLQLSAAAEFKTDCMVNQQNFSVIRMDLFILFFSGYIILMSFSSRMPTAKRRKNI